jgi:hypothetical protein
MGVQNETKILQITKPEIQLDPLRILDLDTKDGGAKMSEIYGYYVPYVTINGEPMGFNSIENLTLDCEGFVPRLSMYFIDYDNVFTAKGFPGDGKVVSVYISGPSDDTFKPIRIDFDVESIQPFAGGDSDYKRFTLNGKMRIPYLYRDVCEFYQGTSFQTLLEISKNLKLGFASNVENTIDEMSWINPADTTERFIKDITLASYNDDESFFVSFIDPYYNLNFVEVNRLLSLEKDVEISYNYMLSNPKAFLEDPDINDKMKIEEGGILSNALSLSGTTRKFDKYVPYNNTARIVTKNGYRKFSQHYDVAEKIFISEFVDPISSKDPTTLKLKGRNVVTRNYEVLPEYELTTLPFKTKYLGKQNDNMHPNFTYAIVLNHQNIVEMSKIGMEVYIEGINPALHMFQRVLVLVYNYGSNMNSLLNPEERKNNPLYDTPEIQNQAPQASEFSQNSSFNAGGDAMSSTMNSLLSGFYLIKGFTYIYQKGRNLRTKVILGRREFYEST